MNARDHGIPIGVVIAEASPSARVDELIDAMTTPARERAIVREQRAHERRVVGEAVHVHAWTYTYDRGDAMHCDDCGAARPARRCALRNAHAGPHMFVETALPEPFLGECGAHPTPGYRARERRIVLEHGPLPPLEFTGAHITLGEMLAMIASIEADQSIRVENVLREPVTGKRIGLAFRLEHR